MTDMIGQILTIILFVLGVGIVGIGVYIYSFQKKYKHNIIIKNSINGAKLVTKDRFKVIKKPDGAIWWKLQKIKKEILPAPQTCVEVDNKGNMFVQYYRLDGDTFLPSKDSFDYNDEDITKEIISKVQPYTTEERAIMVNQHVKAMRNKTSTLGEKILQAVPYMAVVMILLIFMIFFNDAVKPIHEVGDQFSSVASSLSNTTASLDNIFHDKVHVYGEEELLKGEVVNEPPPN